MSCFQIPQDLHIHTIFSNKDGAVHPMQTAALIRRYYKAEVTGISDHFEMIEDFGLYSETLRKHGFYVGCEVDGSKWAGEAAALPFDYYMYHLRDIPSEYEGRERLLDTGKPVIVSHPFAFGADLSKLPDEAVVELNNRYIWRVDWENLFAPHVKRLRFVVGSDAHQPNWLNQDIARQAMEVLGVDEHRVFPGPAPLPS